MTNAFLARASAVLVILSAVGLAQEAKNQPVTDRRFIVAAKDFQDFPFMVGEGVKDIGLSGHFEATGGNASLIYVLVMTDDQFTQWQKPHDTPATPENGGSLYNSGPVSQGNIQLTLPDVPANYHVVFNNLRFPYPKSVETDLTLGRPSINAPTAVSAKEAIRAPGTQASGNCGKNISFAVAEGGQIVSRAPGFTQKWISKNQKQYPGLCFSQNANSNAANYVLVFSTSISAFNGLYPTLRTNTSTSTNPVSGSGMITDNYGGMWSYTYNGTATTTTTTTTHENLPYTDTSNTLYLYSYDQHGKLISWHWRTITTRQGGDGANTLGYNLGAALFSIHFKEHLLKDAVSDIARASR
jgi:YD repeat-containing protein